MGELVDRDQEHLKLVEIGFYIMAGLSAFLSLFATIYIFLGAVFLSPQVRQSMGPNPPPDWFGWIFVVLGILMLILGLAWSVLNFYAGRGVRQRRRRILCLVLSGLTCLQVPWGTAIGILSILVLNRDSVIPLFEQQARQPATPPALH